MCQYFPSIRCLSGQVSARNSLSSITALISATCSFAGKNVHDKWLFDGHDHYQKGRVI
jgi:hypothetical protein